MEDKGLDLPYIVTSVLAPLMAGGFVFYLIRYQRARRLFAEIGREIVWLRGLRGPGVGPATNAMLIRLALILEQGRLEQRRDFLVNSGIDGPRPPGPIARPDPLLGGLQRGPPVPPPPLAARSRPRPRRRFQAHPDMRPPPIRLQPATAVETPAPVTPASEPAPKPKKRRRRR